MFLLNVGRIHIKLFIQYIKYIIATKRYKIDFRFFLKQNIQFELKTKMKLPYSIWFD